MSAPKQKPAAKKRLVRPAPAKKRPVEKRSARDPFAGPSSARQIERSLDQGTRKTLAAFRTDINWD